MSKKEDFSIMNLGEEDKQFSPKSNCKLCTSDFKGLAEELYDAGKSISYIHKELMRQGIEISYPATRNHLLYHYNIYNNLVRVKECAQDVKRWMSFELSKENELRSRVAILKKQMFTILSESEDVNLEEKRKSAKVIKELITEMNNCEERLNKLNYEMEPVYALVQSLEVIIANELKKCTNIETKASLINIINELKEKMREIEQ